MGSFRNVLRRGAWRLSALAAAAACIAAVVGVLGSASARAGASDAYSAAVIGDGAAAYWRLGESSGTSLSDSKGTAGGTFFNGVLLNRSGAIASSVDSAASFDGIDDYASIPDTGVLDPTTAVTVEFWVKRARTGVFQVLVAKPGNGQSKLEEYAVWFDSTNHLAAYFGNGSSYVRVGSGVLDTNWHHVAATYDNATARLYVDGVQVGAVAATGIRLTPNTLPVNLGRAQGGGYYFQGLLDEVAVYPSALTAAQIRSHFDVASSDTAPPIVALAAPVNGSSTSSPSPTFSGVAGSAAGDASIIQVKVYGGGVAGGSPVQTLTAARQADNGYAAVASSLLPDGVYTAQAEQVDAASNLGKSAPSTFTVDTAAPSPSITSPAAGSTVAATTPTISGNAGTAAGDGATVTVKVYAGGAATGTPARVATATRQGDGTYSAAISPALAPGTYTVQSEQADAAANLGRSVAVTFSILDSVPPVVTITAPANNLFTNVTAPTISGIAGSAAGDASTVIVKVYAGTAAGGTPLQTLSASVQADKSYSVSASLLAPGPYTAQAEQSDDASNLGRSAPIGFTVDTAAPAVTLTSPADGASTTDATPIFSGTGGTSSGDSSVISIKIWPGTTATGTPVQTTTAQRAANGSFLIELTSALPSGVYTVRAEQSDSAGNVGVSAASTFSLTAAPGGYSADVASDLPRIYLRLGESSGTVATDETGANNGTYVNGVTLGGGGGIPTESNRSVFFDGVNDYVNVPNAASLGMTTSVTIEAWVKRSKSSAYQVIVAKPGNGQSKLENYALWLNTANQVVAFFGDGSAFVSVYGPALDTNWHQVAATYDNATAKIYVDGQLRASQSSAVRLTPNTLALQVGRAGSDNSYFFGGQLDEVAVYGTALAAARIKSHYDIAQGNDLVAPNVAITSPAAGGAIASTTPTIRGVAGTAPGDLDTVTVKLYSGTAAAGPPLRSYTTTRAADGAFSIVSSPAMSEGTYTVTGEQADAAGNSGRSAPTTFRIDATAPAPTLTTPSNGSLANATPTFAGAAGIALGDSAAVTVRVYPGSSATGSPVLTLPVTAAADHTYSVDAPSALAGGTYTAITQQSDDAGNLGSSAPSTFTVTSADVTSPTVTMTAPANGSSSQGGFPAFGGAAGTAAGDLSTVTVRIYLGLSPTGTPVESISATASGATWSGTVDIALPEGTYVAQADQSDAAGNTGSSGAVIFTVGMAYRDVVVADGASAYWRFGESSGITATDALGGNSGTYSSGVTLNRVGGLLPDTNKSIALDGVTGAVTVADSPGLDFTTGATIEVWVKRAKSGAYQVVVGKAGDGQSKNESYALWISSNDHLAAYFGDRSSYVSVFSTGPLDGNWHYVVATYDNSVARLYVDGVLNNAQPSAVHLTPNNLPLNIGRDSSGTYMFQGQLDEVAVYPLALTAQQVATHYGRGDAFDSDPPKVTLATPMAGTTTSDTTPDFAGMAPVTATDSATVSVNLYAGTSPTGTPISTLTTTRYARGSWNAEVPTPLAQGTYTVQAQEVDNSGNVGTSNPVIFTVGPRPDPGTDPVVLAAGDISYCGGTGDDSTALLLDQFPTASVFTMGDNAYEHGTVDEFQNCYDPTWGRAKARTYPTPGDHDYSTANGAAYFNYFAAQLAPFAPTGNDPNRGWYSFDLGSWHIAMTNSNCGNSAPLCNNDAQLQWLQADLAAHPVQCTLVVTQDPRFSSGPVHGSVPEQKPVWDILIAAGADVVLTADDHDYERFGHQDTQGFASPTGPREFVVGTGGRSHYLFSDPNAVIQPNSEVRDDATWGVIKLNLRAGSYDWEFVPTLGATFTDSGSDTCH